MKSWMYFRIIRTYVNSILSANGDNELGKKKAFSYICSQTPFTLRIFLRFVVQCTTKSLSVESRWNGLSNFSEFFGECLG